MRIAAIPGLFGLVAILVGCGQSTPTAGPQGDRGPAGPPGPQGERGPPGPAGGGGIRIIRTACNDASCAAQCAADEVLLTAYCGVMHNPPVFPSERSATCRARGPANSPLVLACAKAPPQ